MGPTSLLVTRTKLLGASHPQHPEYRKKLHRSAYIYSSIMKFSVISSFAGRMLVVAIVLRQQEPRPGNWRTE